MKAEVIVAEDQLSLAIGKHGQNVRLASRLIGWELDIRTKDTTVMGVKEDKGAPEKIKEEKGAESSLGELSGVGEKILSALTAAGFSSLNDIAKADVAALTEIKGIGPKKAQKLIEEAKKIILRVN